MTIFDPGTIVRVPFPYVERNYRRPRPAVVVTGRKLAEDIGLVWTIMITSAERQRWPGDIVVSDHEACGLPIPSIIRTSKIAAAETASLSALGTLRDEDLAAVVQTLREYLPLGD